MKAFIKQLVFLTIISIFIIGCNSKPEMSAEVFASKICKCAQSTAEMVEYLEKAEVENTDSLYRVARKTFKSIKPCVGTTESEITRNMKQWQAKRYGKKVIREVHRQCSEIADILNF
jgi:hypothetical protein